MVLSGSTSRPRLNWSSIALAVVVIATTMPYARAQKPQTGVVLRYKCSPMTVIMKSVKVIRGQERTSQPVMTLDEFDVEINESKGYISMRGKIFNARYGMFQGGLSYYSTDGSISQLPGYELNNYRAFYGARAAPILTFVFHYSMMDARNTGAGYSQTDHSRGETQCVRQ